MSNGIDREYRTVKSKVILFSKGFSMGAADIVPGVSGGTVALISGIYEHLVFAISSFRWEEVKNIYKKIILKQDVTIQIPFVFLFVLGSGILTGILSMSRVIPYLMENYTFYTYSLFFGLIAFSVTIPYRKMKHAFLEYLILAVFAAVTFFLMGIEPYKAYKVSYVMNNQEITVPVDDNGKFQIALNKNDMANVKVQIFENNRIAGIIIPEAGIREYELENLKVFFRTKENNESILLKGTLAKISPFRFVTYEAGRYLWIFIVAAIAICAMILPGISGAYMLVLFGEYQNILRALHTYQWDVLFVFVAGVATGILSFVRLLKFLLQNYYSVTMAALTGFLAGSLYKIFPLRYLDNQEDPSRIATGILIAIAGALLLVVLEKLSAVAGDPEPPV